MNPLCISYMRVGTEQQANNSQATVMKEYKIRIEEQVLDTREITVKAKSARAAARLACTAVIDGSDDFKNRRMNVIERDFFITDTAGDETILSECELED